MIFESIGGILLVISIILAIKFAKGVIKTVFFISLILTVVLAGFGFLVLKDAVEFKAAVESDKMMFLAYSGEDILTGVVTYNGMSNFTIVNESDINAFDLCFKDNDYGCITKSVYKTFIIDIASLKDSGDIELPNDEIQRKIPAEMMVEILNSSDPKEVFVDYLLLTADDISKSMPRLYYEKQMQNLGSDYEFKGRAFIFLFSAALAQEGPLMIISEYKKGNVIVYPETIMFKILKFIPTGYISNIWESKGIQAGSD